LFQRKITMRVPIRALGLVLLILAAVGGWRILMLMAGGQYLRLGQDPQITDARQQLEALRFQLNDLRRTVRLIQVVRVSAKSARERLQRSYPEEEKYGQIAFVIIETIDRMKSNGALSHLFHPDDEVFARLLQLQDWLRWELDYDHPLLGTDSLADEKLRRVEESIGTYWGCLAITQHNRDDIRREATSCLRVAGSRADLPR
jgi:hypothetical protein